MGQTQLTGSITAGPPSASQTTFPGITALIPLNLSSEPKTWQVATGVLTRSINQPTSGWLTLDGVGVGHTVEAGHLLYLRTNGSLTIRITQLIAGAPVQSIVVVKGPFILETDDSSPIQLIEVQGNAVIEYFVQGNK